LIGKKLGHFEITGALGKGGMGEVYRALDTKLGREVALKVLPQEFSKDPERGARFEREARVLASLQHSNIASIFGFEHIEGVRFLTMELAEGEDLSQRIERGPLSIEDTLRIAEQIALGLEAAHQRNIIHRDLKPANVKVDASGNVKILDFGLARAYTGDPGESDDLANSPTITAAMTHAGVILGTAAYMSPEQAKGRAVDQRSDIWSFGVLIFEMLCGQKLFAGETVSETMAEVMKSDIDLSALPKNTPDRLVGLLKRCLDRDPQTRLQSIGEARIVLQGGSILDEPTPSESVRSQSRFPGPWLLVAAAVLVIGTILTVKTLQPGDQSGFAGVVRATLPLPAGHVLVGGPEISPDGNRIAFISTDGSELARVYTRTLDDDELSIVAGSEGATNCFFSPDGTWIAFYAQGALFKAKVSGGSAFRLADAPSMAGGCWLNDGTIIFTNAWNSGLYRMSENGGEITPLLIPDREEYYAFVWPKPFPGEKTLLFNRWGKSSALMTLDLASLTPALVQLEYWRRGIPSPTGHLLVTGNTGDLLAFPGIPEAGSTSTPEPVLSNVDNGQNSGSSRFSLSDGGTLVYSSIDRSRRKLVSVDLEGRITDLPGQQINYENLEVSPDAEQIVFSSGFDLYVQDLARGNRLPLARGLRGAQDRPIWDLEGRHVLFGSNNAGDWDIYSTQVAEGSPIEDVLRRTYDQYPEAMAPDGTLLYRESHPETGEDLWLLPPDGEPEPWLNTTARENQGCFSADGELIAFVSDAPGRPEVYVKSRSEAGEMVSVSMNGGFSPTWSPNEDRIYFRAANRIMMSEIQRVPRLTASEPVELFDGGWVLGDPLRYGRRGYAVMADETLLMIANEPEAIPTRLNIIFNWFEELERRAPMGD
jgi:serine/threonine protein kinase